MAVGASRAKQGLQAAHEKRIKTQDSYEVLTNNLSDQQFAQMLTTGVHPSKLGN